MKEKLLEQAKREYSSKQRIVALLFLAPIFLFLLPFLFTIFNKNFYLSTLSHPWARKKLVFIRISLDFLVI